MSGTRPLVVAVLVGCVAWTVADTLQATLAAWLLVPSAAAGAAGAALAGHEIPRVGARRSPLEDALLGLLSLGLAAVAVALAHLPWLLITPVRAASPGGIRYSVALSALPALAAWSLGRHCARRHHRQRDPRSTGAAAEPVQRDLEGLFGLGALVGVVAAGIRWRFLGEDPVLDGSTLALLGYVLLGPAALQRARLRLVVDRWRAERPAQVRPGMSRRWTATAGISLAGAAAVVLIGSALAPAPLRDLVTAVPGSLEGELTEIPQDAAPTDEERVPAGGPLEWLLPGLTLLVIAVVLAVLVQAGGRRARRGMRGRNRGLARELLLLVGAWLLGRRGGGEPAGWQSERLDDEANRDGSPQRPRRARLLLTRRRVRPEDPRARVIEDYVGLLHRAEQAGMGRAPSQTPAEYGAQLSARLPERRDQIAALTASFVEARYSTHRVGDEQARRTSDLRRKLSGALPRPGWRALLRSRRRA